MDLATLKRVFAKIDTQATGSISIKNMHDALSKIGIQASLQETEALISLVDQRGARTLNFQDFCHLMYVVDNAVRGDLASIAFLIADVDYTKTVEEDELRRLLKILGISLDYHEVHYIMQRYSDSGCMTYHQFLSFINRLK